MLDHIIPSEIQSDYKYYRRNLLNSISGLKSANLVGTVDERGVGNLGLFSSVFHIGASPSLLGLIMRPLTVERQTYDYIKSKGCYTINHVNSQIMSEAHWTSAKFDKGVNEFEACGLEEVYMDGFNAPYVGEAQVKLGLKFVEEHLIQANNTILIIGEVEHIYLPSTAVMGDGNLDFELLNGVSIGGLEMYYNANKLAHFNFARPYEKPINKL